MKRRPLRVAYVLRAFPRLSETFILGEILALQSQGVEVHVVALERVTKEKRHPEAEALMSQVSFVPRKLMGLPRQVADESGREKQDLPAGDHPVYRRAARWASRLLVRKGIQHVHAHFAGPAAATAAAISRETGIPYSFTAHAKDIFSRRVDWDWLRPLSRHAHAVVTVCDYNLDFLTTRLPDARIERIYNGIDLGWWQPSSRPPHPHRIVSVGRLVHKKGFHVLVDAVALLRDWDVPAHATLIGDGIEGERLLAKVRERRLEGRVRLAGSLTRSEVRRILRSARAVAAPCVVAPNGNQDALPTVLLEAGACAVPAVTTSVAGIPEIVKHRRTGWLVPSEDAAALARALRRILENPELGDSLGQAARARMEKRFDHNDSAAALVELFTHRRPAPSIPR